jgi:hypothetical protein
MGRVVVPGTTFKRMRFALPVLTFIFGEPSRPLVVTK